MPPGWFRPLKYGRLTQKSIFKHEENMIIHGSTIRFPKFSDLNPCWQMNVTALFQVKVLRLQGRFLKEERHHHHIQHTQIDMFKYVRTNAENQNLQDSSRS